MLVWPSVIVDTSTCSQYAAIWNMSWGWVWSPSMVGLAYHSPTSVIMSVLIVQLCTRCHAHSDIHGTHKLTSGLCCTSNHFSLSKYCKWPTMKVGSYNMSSQVAFSCGHHTCPMLWEIHSCDVLVNDRVFSLCCWIDHCRVQQVCYKMSHPLSQAWGCYWGAFSVTGNSCPLLRTPIRLWDAVRY